MFDVLVREDRDIWIRGSLDDYHNIGDAGSIPAGFAKEVYFDKEGIAYCKPLEVKYCSCCGKDLCHDTEGSLCFDCNNKKRREDMLSKYGDITKDKLFEMLKNESFLSVGKKLGVSDNMVRKICDIFGIPRHASYYRKLKD